ncbi:MAG: YkgJ family cysteine cluster protein [Deltaproteobacteria bacterium]|nr:YkgJ family cysteine cluster protein [Deltaproteobacteria bacterium]
MADLPPLPARPWLGIARGLAILDAPPAPDTPRDVLCLSCRASPCCWIAGLHELEPMTLADLDRIRYWLGFDRLMVGVQRLGGWRLFYRQPCAHLDRATYLCGVHGTDDKPRVCQAFDPTGCHYRANLIGGRPGPDLVQLDLRRFQAVLERVEVDARGRITSMPSWDEVREVTAAIDIEELRYPPPQQQPADLDALRAPLDARPAPARGAGLGAWDSPCQGCRAPCCEKVLVPMAAPSSAAAVDYLRYLLNFEGLEIGVADTDTWLIVVHTRCRHFDADTRRCTVFGQPERPLVCAAYDPWSCDYPERFGPWQGSDILRLDRGDWPTLEALLATDEDGRVLARPDRQAVLDAMARSAEEDVVGAA